MAYQRGSEEFYRGSAPGVGYSAPTLDLLNQQTRRMMDQQDKIGQLNAEGIEGAGRDFGAMIGNLPGAYMRGAEFKQNSEKHALGQREGESRLNQAEKTGRLTEEQIRMGGLTNDSMAAKNRMQDLEDQYLTGTEEGGKARYQQQIDQKMKDSKLANQVSESSIRSSDASTGLTKVQTDVARSTIGKTATEEKVNKAAAFYAAGNEAMALRIPLSEIDRERAKIQGKQQAGSASATANLVGAGTATGGAALSRVGDVNSKMTAIQDLQDAKALLGKYAVGSSERNALETRINEDMKMIDPRAGGLSSSLGKLSPNFSGQNWYKSQEDQVKESLTQAKQEVSSKLKVLEATAGAGRTPEVMKSIEEHRNLLNQLETADEEGKKNEEKNFLETATGQPYAPNQSNVKKIMQSTGKPSRFGKGRPQNAAPVRGH